MPHKDIPKLFNWNVSKSTISHFLKSKGFRRFVLGLNLHCLKQTDGSSSSGLSIMSTGLEKNETISSGQMRPGLLVDNINRSGLLVMLEKS